MGDAAHYSSCRRVNGTVFSFLAVFLFFTSCFTTRHTTKALHLLCCDSVRRHAGCPLVVHRPLALHERCRRSLCTQRVHVSRKQHTHTQTQADRPQWVISTISCTRSPLTLQIARCASVSLFGWCSCCRCSDVTQLLGHMRNFIPSSKFKIHNYWKA